jgi:hypothetical protein
MPLRERAGAGIDDLDAQVLIVEAGPAAPGNMTA